MIKTKCREVSIFALNISAMNRFTPVYEIMTEKVVFARTRNKFSEVQQFFIQFHVHHLPVLDDHDTLVGIISSTDLIKVYEEVLSGHTFVSKDDIDHLYPIAKIMSSNPVTVSSEETLHSAAKKLNENKIQSVPVVDNNVLKGILTVRDFVANVFN